MNKREKEEEEIVIEKKFEDIERFCYFHLRADIPIVRPKALTFSRDIFGIE